MRELLSLGVAVSCYGHIEPVRFGAAVTDFLRASVLLRAKADGFVRQLLEIHYER